MKKAFVIAAILLLIVASAVAALTYSGLINLGTLSAKNFDITPAESPEDGVLVRSLDTAGFTLDEDGNVNIPNMLLPETAVQPIAYEGETVSWAHGTVNVRGGGQWVDSHPVENPTGASCAIINPYDNYPFGSTDYPLNTTTQSLNIASVYKLWPGSNFCEITTPGTGGNAVSCVLEQVGGVARLRALQANGTTATSVGTGTKVRYEGSYTKLDFHRYSCGIMRDPSTDTSDILEWKLASINASREQEDMFFVFVKDENGDYFNEAALCAGSGCVMEGHYQGLQVAWFIWRVEE